MNPFLLYFILSFVCVLVGYYFSVKVAFLERALELNIKLKPNNIRNGIEFFDFSREFFEGPGPFHLTRLIKNSRADKFWPKLISYASPHEGLQKEINQAVIVLRLSKSLFIFLFLAIFFQIG